MRGKGIERLLRQHEEAVCGKRPKESYELLPRIGRILGFARNCRQLISADTQC